MADKAEDKMCHNKPVGRPPPFPHSSVIRSISK